MSKGSRHRSINQTFKNNFDDVKWPEDREFKYANKRQKAPDRKVHHIMPDIEPYKAMGGDMAGKYIGSRSTHREYLKRNNFIEVGNEKDYFFKHNGKTHDNPTKDWGKGG